MITTDINGVEINIGDEVYACIGANIIRKIQILKETEVTIHYKYQLTKDWWGQKKGDWTNKTYMYKTSRSFKNMLKV